MSTETDTPITATVVVAFCDKTRGMCYQGGMPWPFLREDYEFFMNIITTTTDPNKKNGVLKGRLCWETMPEENKTKNHILVTSTSIKETPPKCKGILASYEEGMEELEACVRRGEVEKIYILGGQKNYQHALDDPRVKQLIITKIFQDFPVDGFFPEYQHCFHLVNKREIKTDKDVTLSFETWERNAS